MQNNTKMVQPIQEAVTHMQDVTNRVEDATIAILKVADKLQHLIIKLPQSNEKNKLMTAVTELYEACNFESLAKDQTSEVIMLLSNGKPLEGDHNKNPTKKAGLLTQEEADKYFEGI